MLRKHKQLFLVVTLGFAAGAAGFSPHVAEGQEGGTVDALEPMASRRLPEGVFRRVERQVAALKQESLEQSLTNLADWELYYFPGAVIEESGRTVLPLDANEGTGTVERILSNRRFLKVYEELKACQPAEASRLLNARFAACSEEYLAKYAQYVAKGRRLAPARPSGPPRAMKVVGWGGGTDEDDLPNLQCMRWQLLGLCLLAGNLQVRGSASWVRQLTEEAQAQRDYLYQDSELSEGFRAVTLASKSLYNRQILGCALIGTCSDPSKGRAALAAMGKETPTRRLAAYDAVRTAYDVLLMPGPVDFSKGSLSVQHLPALTDEEFEQVVAAVLSSP
jgi:hypothetical protein